MTEQELRALVRDAVARHLGADGNSGLRTPNVELRTPNFERAAMGSRLIARDSGLGASHALYITLVNTGEECVIEPNVTCNHCNYCKSHGH